MSKVKFKGQECRLGGSLPSIDQLAPNFVLADSELKNVSLNDFKGKKKALWVVPSLDTDVCLTSTKKLNEIAKKHSDIVFLVVSADLPFAHKRICSSEKLTNIKTLSSIRGPDFGENYGLVIKEGPLMGLLARAVVVINEHDKVTYFELVPEITLEPNYSGFEAALT